MPCVLRFIGRALDVDRVLDLTPVTPCHVRRIGEPASARPSARVARTSCVSLLASDADFDQIEQQQSETLAFLSEHQAALQSLRGLPDIECAELDFGIAMRNVISQSDAFGEELVVAAAGLRLQLVLSQYPVGRKHKRIKQYRRALRGAI